MSLNTLIQQNYAYNVVAAVITMGAGIRFGSTVHQMMTLQMSGNARRKITTGKITLILFLGVSVALVVPVKRDFF